MYVWIRSFFLHSIDAANNKVDLSMRLSHVDPKAAKKIRKKQEKEISKKRKKTTEKMVTSDGESIELESVESRYMYNYLRG